MKLLSILLCVGFISANTALAAEQKTKAKTEVTKSKKTAMVCEDCGKPESECECKDEKHKKGEHKEDDGHKH